MYLPSTDTDLKLSKQIAPLLLQEVIQSNLTIRLPSPIYLPALPGVLGRSHPRIPQSLTYGPKDTYTISAAIVEASFACFGGLVGDVLVFETAGAASPHFDLGYRQFGHVEGGFVVWIGGLVLVGFGGRVLCSWSIGGWYAGGGGEEGRRGDT